jgi:hypothetical protein
MKATYFPGSGPWWASPWGVGAGAVRGDTQGQTLSGHDELLVRTGRTLTECPRQGSRPFSEEVDD